ncbi:Vault protein inter-alpha-trypsin domain [Mactra antiquata]
MSIFHKGIDCQVVSVKKLAVTSRASIRYAKVNIHSVVENLEMGTNEVEYSIRIPKSAFITGFRMLVNGKNITAVIMEKNEASGVYTEAKENKITAGTVTQQSAISDDMDVNVFSVAVTLAGKMEVEYFLDYEERIQKNGGKYKQVLYIDSNQVIPNLEIKCAFRENQQINSLKYITPFGTEIEIDEGSSFSEDGFHTQEFVWAPDETEQFSLNKPFEVEFDLDTEPNGGMVIYNNDGEFVHLFSTPCDDSEIMTKQITFVIDISGSMAGNPILQVRQAMNSILSLLRVHDYFNILLFEGTIKMWRLSFQKATADTIEDAKYFVETRALAKGATNINEALLGALDIFERGQFESAENTGNMIVFLTDGAPTSGVTNTKRIRNNLQYHNYVEGKCCRATISTIAFGIKADVEFLRLIAIEHEGTFTAIKDINNEYADGELIQAYEEIENPYYKNLKFSYMVGDVLLPDQNVTRNSFLQYDCGSELLIGGWTKPQPRISPSVRVNGVSDEVVFDSVGTLLVTDEDSEILSRLVSYQRVQSLLKQSYTATVREEKENLENMALDIALKFGFVTPITSLVVTEYTRKSVSGQFGSKAGRDFTGFSNDWRGSGSDFYDNFYDPSQFDPNRALNSGSKGFDLYGKIHHILLINGAIACYKYIFCY